MRALIKPNIENIDSKEYEDVRGYCDGNCVSNCPSHCKTNHNVETDEDVLF